MTWAPTTDQILDLDGVHRRVDSFRFELCDRDLRPIGELHPDRTASTPTIQNDADNNTSRRLTGFRLLPDEAADVNVIRDRLRVYMVLQNGVEYRLGTFLWADANTPVRSWGDQQDADLVDFTYVLDQQSTQAWGWSKGTGIFNIVMLLVQRAGFGLDDFALSNEQAGTVLTNPMSWQPGSTWLQIITDLANVLGFGAPWFDRDGKFHFESIPDPAVASLTVPAYEIPGRIVADSIVRSNEIVSAPNDFAVFDSGTDRIIHGRYQVPPEAPHSFANRGFRIGQVETVQGLQWWSQANLAATNLARRAGRAYETLSFTSTADPRHDTWDVVDAFDQRWLETAWSLELRSGGLMQHTMRRTTYAVA